MFLETKLWESKTEILTVEMDFVFSFTTQQLAFTSIAVIADYAMKE